MGNPHNTMEWYFYGFAGMVSFSIMILLFKKMMTMGLSSLSLIVLTFGMVFAIFMGYVFLTKSSLTLPTGNILIFFLIASLLSFVGNLMYTKAIETAPNVGYATTINALQIVLVSIGAMLFFQQGVTPFKAVGILLGIISIILLAL